MSEHAAVATGIGGGIGDAIGTHLRHQGRFVIGLDLRAPDDETRDRDGSCHTNSPKRQALVLI